jgi:hypothetical protein
MAARVDRTLEVEMAARKRSKSRKRTPARKKAAARKTTRRKVVRKKKPAKKKAKKKPARKATRRKATPRKATARKAGRKPAPARAASPAPIATSIPVPVGKVTHYYGNVNAAIVALDAGELRVGDMVHFRGHTTDFYQRVDHMEVDHAPVTLARAGQVIGLQVAQRVREHDSVTKVAR